MAETSYPRIIMGLDVSTSCIGVSIIKDNGDDKPEILVLTHKSPKLSKKVKGIEALFLKKNIFEKEFLEKIYDEYLKDEKITDVVIEEPLVSSNNVNTVATLLRFNGMVSESVYRVLGVVPNFISSYDARMYSFPELVSIRKYNRKGKEYPLKHIQREIKNDKVVLFGSYPFDVDKKTVMKNMIDEMYPGINWVKNKKDELKKENFDACDSLVCAIAYMNVNHYGVERPTIVDVSTQENEESITINYSTKIWDRTYTKKIILDKDKPLGEKEDF